MDFHCVRFAAIFAILLQITSGVSTAADRAVFTTTDFSSGSLALLDLETLEAATNLVNIHSDAAVRTHNGRIYVINRLGQDNVTVIDPDNPQGVPVQYSVGNGTNPQDIAFLSDTKAYVARLQSPRLLILNPVNGDSLGSIDLSFAADADGFPEPAHLELVGSRLYVTCQRLDQDNFYSPTDYSEIVVIDTRTDLPVDLDAAADGIQGIRLQATNPFGQVRIGHQLFLGCSGAWGVADGGVEVVDLSLEETLGVQLHESALGGGVGSVAMVTSTRGYVVVSDASFINHVKAFDLSTDAIPTNLEGVSGGYIPQISVFRGRLYVSDQGSFSAPGSAGIVVFDVFSNERTAGPLSTGLPPNSAAFLPDPSSTLTTDYDGDGRVGFPDFLLFVASFGTSSGQLRFEGRFDLDGSGRVDFNDFLLFVADFGRRTS